MQFVNTDVMLFFTYSERKKRERKVKKNYPQNYFWMLGVGCVRVLGREGRGGGVRVGAMTLKTIHESTFNGLVVKIHFGHPATGVLPHLTDSSHSSISYFLPLRLP